jgi:hypothetical protein
MQQVLPPIERLCEPITGTDRARLAECLGKSTNLPSFYFSLVTVPRFGSGTLLQLQLRRLGGASVLDPRFTNIWYGSLQGLHTVLDSLLSLSGPSAFRAHV